jgi:hypothetical protein
MQGKERILSIICILIKVWPQLKKKGIVPPKKKSGKSLKRLPKKNLQGQMGSLVCFSVLAGI